jgi:hypothetical protein
MIKEYKGKDSPGFSKYNPDGTVIRPQDPKFSIGKFDRFHLPEQDTTIRSMLPVQYQSSVPTYFDAAKYKVRFDLRLPS